jgi:hypothetical protein
MGWGSSCLAKRWLSSKHLFNICCGLLAVVFSLPRASFPDLNLTNQISLKKSVLIVVRRLRITFVLWQDILTFCLLGVANIVVQMYSQEIDIYVVVWRRKEAQSYIRDRRE